MCLAKEMNTQVRFYVEIISTCCERLTEELKIHFSTMSKRNLGAQYKKDNIKDFKQRQAKKARLS